MNNLPSGTITFLFTDIEGSTRLWEEHPEAMRAALITHDSLLKKAVESNNGQIVKSTGDGVYAVFTTAIDAARASLDAQFELQSSEFMSKTGVPIRARMGLHTGESQERDGDYFGMNVNMAARVMGLGYGGQVLLSEITAILIKKTLPASSTLVDLGEHRLKGIASPERIFQLCHPDLLNVFPPLKSLAAFKHNLHTQLSSFIGREKELADVKHLLNETRLLTLLGPGGTGKTRLMSQVAEEVIEDYPDGVWLVELAPLTDPDRVVERVATTLNIERQPGRPLLDTLTNHLRRKELLLLLDNVEHLVRESAELSEHLLTNCPSIKILVTGREALFISGETTLQIPSLSLPGKGEQSLEAVASSEAVQLFLARAQAVRPDFALTPGNAAAITEVVFRLDGIPLALELAAARLRMMSVEQIAARLNDRFRLLTGGSRTALPRQQTLQALIDWSWNLLDGQEQVLLRRLAVFTGGWTLDAAQAVASGDQLDEYEVLDLLDQLINKSLVAVKHLPHGEARYNMLESIRQYAQDRLLEAGEGEDLRNRHAEYYTAFCEHVSQGLQGREMLVWLERLFLETDNAKAAREWILDTRLDLALRTAGAATLISRYWFFSSEDIRWLEQVVRRSMAQPGADTDLELRKGIAKAVIALGTTIIDAGDFEKGRQILEEGITLAREVGVVEQRVFGLNMLLISLYHMGELRNSVHIAEQSLELSHQHGLDFWRLMALGYHVSVLVLLGEDAMADAYAEEAILLAKMLDNPWLNALTSFQLARLESHRENWDQAEKHAAKAADLFEVVRDYGLALTARSELGHMKRIMGDWAGAEQVYRMTIIAFQERGHTSAVAHQLECMGMIATGQRQYHRAAKLLGAGQAIRAAVQINRLPAEQIEFDHILGQLVEAMGEDTSERALAEGAEMSLDEAVSFALKETP
ncbi:MAG: adenylate/guanylate cyclase domain-containing protein [Anaerolineales bacterium]